MLPIWLSSLATGLAVAFGFFGLELAIDSANNRLHNNLHERMARVGMDVASLRLYLRLRWYGASLIFLIGWLWLNMLPVAIMAALLFFQIYGHWLEGRIETQRATLRDQLPSAVRDLASQVRAGLPLAEALVVASRDVPAPLGEQLQRTVNLYKQGRTMQEALGELKDRLQIDGVSLLVIALLVAEERGGNIAVVLDRISHSTDEIRRVERKRESNTAAGQLLIRVLAVIPVIFLAFFSFLDPEGTALVFQLVLGQIVLSVAGSIVYVSVRWMQLILVRVE
jgi:Flp pilus assembly protein TadB